MILSPQDLLGKFCQRNAPSPAGASHVLVGFLLAQPPLDLENTFGALH